MRQTQKPRIVNLLMLTVAGMINAFGITLFMTPVKLYDSGISGTSMLLEQITPSCLSLSLFLLILNIPLFLVGLKKQGGLFTFYAIYTVEIYFQLMSVLLRRLREQIYCYVRCLEV